MTDQPPEPSKHAANWLQRLWQSLQPKTGDTITAEIGENVQHTAVGKNIFQIIGNTLNIPTPLVIAITVSVVIIAGVVILLADYGNRIAVRLEATSTPTPVPSQTPIPTTTPTLAPTASPSPTPTLFATGGLTETLVVLADFVDADNKDSRFVTKDFFDEMRDKLAVYPNIRVELLHRPIPDEGGSKLAMELGKTPEINATIIIWGQYVTNPPKMYIHFDIVKSTNTYLNSGFKSRLGAEILTQPSMLDFEIKLGDQLSDLVAFANGLTLFNARQNKEAEPLFNTASEALMGTLASDFAQAIHFYRGTNYGYLGRYQEAQPDLEAGLPSQPPGESKPDELYLSIINNIGLAYSNLGDKQKALAYYNQALLLQQQVGDKNSEATTLANLGHIYYALGDKQKALEFSQNAAELDHQIGDKWHEVAIRGDIAFLLAQQGKLDEAAVEVETAIKLAEAVSHTDLNKLRALQQQIEQMHKDKAQK